MTPPRIEAPASAADRRERFPAAYSILETAIRDRAFPGAAFGVLSNNEVLALDGVGAFTYAPPLQEAERVTAATVYDLASLTKVIATTSMAMLLHQRGRLSLDRPIDELLPGFAGNDLARKSVTVRMLLAHASGLPAYAPLFATCPDARSLWDACLRLPLEASPGQRYAYSDPGFILLGCALEKLAGQSLAAFCDAEVFAPLRMSSTRFSPPSDWRLSIPPTEEDVEFRRRVIQGEVQDENCFVLGGVAGHAGLFSNALDPLLFARALLEPFAARGAAADRLFSRETVRLFTTRADLPPGSPRALGWDTPSHPSSSGHYFRPHSAGHLGYSGTSLWIDFERGLAIVLLTNRTWPRRGNDAIRAVRPAFHDAILEALPK